MAAGTVGAGFAGSDFSLQPFRRAQGSASLGPGGATRAEGPAGWKQGGTREIRSAPQGGLPTSASLALRFPNEGTETREAGARRSVMRISGKAWTTTQVALQAVRSRSGSITYP